VPVIVNVKLPAAVVEPVVTVNWDAAGAFGEGVTEVGFIEQVAFAGQPETATPTALLNPFKEVTVKVEFPDCPCVSVNEAGLLEMKKSGAVAPVHEPNLKDPMTVLQLKLPLNFRY